MQLDGDTAATSGQQRPGKASIDAMKLLGTGEHREHRGGLVDAIRENPPLAGVGAIGFAVSFQTVAHIAYEKHMPGPAVLYPVGIDVGILALINEALRAIRDQRSDLIPRVLAWGLAWFTVYVNVHGSPAGDWLGRGLHAVMPALWVVLLELVRYRRVAAARTDKIPAGRWIAAPLSSGVMWLRMRRNGITSYAVALETEQACLLARDLIRAAPAEFRPPRSSLVRKRIRSWRLPDEVNRAIRDNGIDGWEAAVTGWVGHVLDMPERVRASLETAHQAHAETARPAVPAASEGASASAPAETPERA